MKKLSIIIPHLNEKNEIIETIKSIQETSSPNTVGIISIDDFSSDPVSLDSFKNIRKIRNEKRMGVDYSRHYGVELSDSKYCLVVDSHMRFRKDNWANKMIDYIDNNPKTLWCTVCCGLGYGKTTMEDTAGKYFAADLRLLSDQEKDRPCRAVLEPKWASEKPGDEYFVSCILGANYFFDKEWFMKIHGLKGLRSWGSSEPALSLKSYLSSGDCKITKQIEIGHVFRDNAPYATPVPDLVYNKLFLLKTIFPKELEEKLALHIPKDGNYNAALKMIDQDKALIENERAYYQSIFKCSIYDFGKRFNIDLP